MSLEHDPRTGTEESGTVTIASGDGSTPATALNIPSDALFKPTRVKIEYEGTADAEVEFYDEADGTSSGNVSDRRDTFTDIENNAVQEFEGPWRDFEEDVLFATEGGNQDGDVIVTVYGVVLTDLVDQT